MTHHLVTLDVAASLVDSGVYDASEAAHLVVPFPSGVVKGTDYGVVFPEDAHAYYETPQALDLPGRRPHSFRQPVACAR